MWDMMPMTSKPFYHPLWLPGVLEHYYDVVRLISKIMPPHLRRVYDAEDFVQMAICDMLDRPERYNRDADDPKHMMVLIAKRRMIDALRRRPNRTPHLPIDDLVLELVEIRKSWGCGAVKSPAEISELTDSAAYVLSRTYDPRERVFLILRSWGYLFDEAAAMVGVQQRTMLRKLERLRSRVRIHVG